MGLDKLIKTKHLLFDGNKFTGSIPESLGLVSTLEVVRLDRNSLSGPVPSNLNNLTKVNELNLANNQLTGTLPDLSGMSLLNYYVDLSNNTFDPSPSPAWFWRLPQLSAMIIQSGRLYGPVPTKLFSSPMLQQVILDDNAFNGNLDMGRSISSELSIVNFKGNGFSSVTVTPSYNGTLAMAGNPVCDRLPNTPYCNVTQRALASPYATSLVKCFSGTCPAGQSLSPQSCACAYPYQGVMYFRAPFFRDVTNGTAFQALESMLWTKLGLTPGSVYLQDPFFNSDSSSSSPPAATPTSQPLRGQAHRLRPQQPDLQAAQGVRAVLLHRIAVPIPSGSSSKSKGVIIGIAVGCGVLVVALAGAAVYAFVQRRRAQKAKEELGGRFAKSGGAPRLKGARWFSYEELKRSTNNFDEANELGYGGYGKGFIAIKRAQQVSMQGGQAGVQDGDRAGLARSPQEPRRILLRAREQMLVYEFMSGGTLRDSLSGKSGLHLDWKKRLRSNNILMDEHLTAKVADFGLSKLVSDSEKGL
ncbi:hypothetical protein EJB05_39830, partial [Eragrostis curvula]